MQQSTLLEMKKREERTPFESHTNMCMTNSALGEELEKTLFQAFCFCTCMML
jgi:hypothetical protein